MARQYKQSWHDALEMFLLGLLTGGMVGLFEKYGDRAWNILMQALAAVATTALLMLIITCIVKVRHRGRR